MRVSLDPLDSGRPTAGQMTAGERQRRHGSDLTDAPRAIALVLDAPEPAAGVLIPRERSELGTRAVNVAIASCLLIAAAPVLIVAAIAIKATSPGPIFYQQTRVGIDRRRRRSPLSSHYDRRGHDFGGRVFKIYKLRTMRADAERESGAVWAAKQDSRVTAVGGLLRKCRVDEIPQLINVLRGEMNIVGPRPERPSIVAKLSRGIPDYSLRLAAKPGITGLAQINQAYDSCLDDVRRKVGYDLEYIQRQSILEDLKIMARTVPVMLFRLSGW
jgi:lipopolysaccharide/colanic/teichoic acid biosynthesis glycosyltransferase